MYTLLLRLMLIAAALQLGLSLSDMAFCHSRECTARIERASRDILKIDWKPISVWPEEAQRFR